MRRFLVFSVLVGSLALVPLADGGSPGADSKEALQAVQEFIGTWNGTGSSSKSSLAWKEKASWSWRFKGNDAWMTVDLENSKIFKHGELRYLPTKKKYQFTLTDMKDQKSVFLGDVKKGNLILERANPETKEVEQWKLATAAGGIRLIATFSVRPAERTLFNQQVQIAYSKEGEALGVAQKSKLPECVVTGGLGTSTVSFMGVTYYVCCTGCRDAFNENPAKIIKEYLARKKAGQ